MILDGEYVFQGPRERVWELLLDPEVMAKAMPGAKRLERVGEGRYDGVIRIGIGPVTAAEWRLAVTISDTVPPERYRMGVDSQGPVGFTRGTATVNLHDEAGATRMVYSAELQIGGRVASVGQRLLDQVAKLLTRQGLEALSRELASRLGEADTAGADTSEPALPPSAPGPAEAAP